MQNLISAIVSDYAIMLLSKKLRILLFVNEKNKMYKGLPNERWTRAIVSK